MNNPLVSVVIPSFNHGHLIGRAIYSVINQSWTNWEIIVVDNNSSDATDSVIESINCGKLRVVKVENHGIIAHSRNVGIIESKGEWIAFLDSDDWWTVDKLEKCLKHANQGADLIYHDLFIIGADGRKKLWKVSKSRKFKTNVYDDLLQNGSGIPNSSVIVKKECMLKIGLLSEDEKLVGWEDFDCWIRIAKSGFRFVRAKGGLGYYWMGGGNVSSESRTLENIKSFLEKYCRDLKEIPWWCYYSRAVAYHHLNVKENVTCNFKKALLSKSAVSSKVRIVLKFISCKLHVN